MSATWTTVEAAAAAGEWDRLRELLRASPPRDDHERRRWWLLLASAGLLAEAEAVASSLADPNLAADAHRLLAGEAPAADPAPEPDDVFALDHGPAPRRAADTTVETFLRWFGGRRDLYARQWYDERRRRSGYRPIREPLTPKVARDHLDGRTTIGQYLLDPDGRCAYGVIDLDLSGDALAALPSPSSEEAPSALAHAGLRTHATRLVEAASRLQLPLFAEDSGGRGIHLWLFLEPRRPARAVRALLGQIVAAAGPQPPDVGVELFPKGDRPGPQGLSTLVKLPLGLHQVTLRRCHLLDARLEPVLDPDEALARLAVAPPDAVEALLGRRVVPLPAPDLAPAPPPAPPVPTDPTPRSLAEALRAIEPGPEQRAAEERMLAGCTILRSLVARAYERHRLEPDEARAVLYTLGLVGRQGGLVEEVFATAGLGRKELERVRRGLPSPAGCARLRRLAGPGATCDCPPGLPTLPYPTPAGFAVGERPPSPRPSTAFAAWLDADAPPVQEPLSAIGDALRRIEERLERLEEGRERDR
jgi:hypothetical protein